MIDFDHRAWYDRAMIDPETAKEVLDFVDSERVRLGMTHAALAHISGVPVPTAIRARRTGSVRLEQAMALLGAVGYRIALERLQGPGIV